MSVFGDMMLGDIASSLNHQQRMMEIQIRNQHDLAAQRDGWQRGYNDLQQQLRQMNVALAHEKVVVAEQTARIHQLEDKLSDMEMDYRDAESKRDKLWDAWAFYRERFRIKSDRFDKADFAIVIRTDDHIEFFD